ncbi:MAG: ATP-binding protein [Syntrophobacteraceae bacterium]
MIAHPPAPAKWARISPWLILGIVCTLAVILIVLAVRNVNHEKEFMTRTLLSEAEILVHSIEAGTRTGMRGMGWGRNQHQVLLQEMAQQSGVLYIALTDARGRILAHSDPDRVNTSMPAPFRGTGLSDHHFIDGEKRVFQVVREYQPWSRHRGDPEECRFWPENERVSKGFLLVVGLDPAPFEEAVNQDLHQTLILFGVMFLVGVGGLLSLTWAQHYRNARDILDNVRALTSAIVNQMPAGLIIARGDGTISESNQFAGEIINRPGGITGNLADYPCFRPVVERLKEEGAAVEQEVRCGNGSGGGMSLLVNATVIRDGELETGFLLLFSDLTKIQHLEKQLRRSERLAGLGRLAAGVAHEIRNPLSTIKGFAAILAERFGKDDGSRIITDSMIQEAERLNRVVSELLDYAGATSLRKEVRSCRELIEYSFRLVESDARSRAVQLRSSISPEDFEMEVDPDRFAQILLNLYLNAFQAMDKGGDLAVEAVLRDGMVTIAVSDSGAGIRPDHLPHIFDPYFTTKPKGVGLGLANVHKLVEAHAGAIEVESIVGAGTTFTMHFSQNQPKDEKDVQTGPSDSDSR